MKKIFGFWMVLFFLGVGVFYPTPAFAEAAAGIIDVGNKICPISGDAIDPEVSYVHEGKRYHFCCAGCIKKLKKDPEKYIAQMKEGQAGSQEHAGHGHGHAS